MTEKEQPVWRKEAQDSAEAGRSSMQMAERARELKAAAVPETLLGVPP